VPNTAGTGKWTEGDPFTGVQSSYYWSSTTFAGGTDYAWAMSMTHCRVLERHEGNYHYVWPVRGGN
jgi:hypothetical protein